MDSSEILQVNTILIEISHLFSFIYSIAFFPHFHIHCILTFKQLSFSPYIICMCFGMQEMRLKIGYIDSITMDDMSLK